MSSQMEKVWEGPEHRSFCPCGVGVHHPLSGVDVFTHLETLQTLSLLRFHGGFFSQAWSIINSIFSSTPLSREGKRAENPKLLIIACHCGDQLPPRSHTGGFIHSSLIRTKDAPEALITQEMTIALEALCQELGTETNASIFYDLTVCQQPVALFFPAFIQRYLLSLVLRGQSILQFPTFLFIFPSIYFVLLNTSIEHYIFYNDFVYLCL